MTVLALSTVATIAAATADWRIGLAVAAVAGAWCGGRETRRASLVVVFVTLGVGVGLRAERQWIGLAPDAVGAFEGWVRVVDDPQPYPGSTRLIVEAGGERYELWARGRARRIRVGEWRGGERVYVSGARRPLDAARRERVAWQHVVGELRLDWASDVTTGSPVDRASNRVRVAIERAADVLPGHDGSLYRGLVVGDDRDQPRAMIERFRASGLSHLTAVSGQNVAFVLAAAGPLLRGLRPWWRWAVTLGLVTWFVSLTRFEPSIVRAGAMAALSATAYVLGRERTPARLLALAVTGLLLADPLLVGSVGFWLSVGATAGVALVGPWLGARLRPLGPLAMPVGVTLGAQIGVVLPAVWVFGRLPLVSVPANLLAVPVAGFVMLYGLPAGLVAGLVPVVGPVVMFPCRVGVRWVDTVAALGERVEPGGATTWVGWTVLAAGCVLMVLGRRPGPFRSAGTNRSVWARRDETAGRNQTRHGDPPADR